MAILPTEKKARKEQNKTHIDKKKLVQWVIDHPNQTRAQIAKLYDISIHSVNQWVSKARRADPLFDQKVLDAKTLALTGKKPKVASGTRRAFIEPAVPEDMCEAAQMAIRLRLKRLATAEIVDGESSKDLRQGMRDIIECFAGLKDIQKTIEKDFDPSKPVDIQGVMQDILNLPSFLSSKNQDTFEPEEEE